MTISWPSQNSDDLLRKVASMVLKAVLKFTFVHWDKLTSGWTAVQTSSVLPSDPAVCSCPVWGIQCTHVHMYACAVCSPVWVGSIGKTLSEQQRLNQKGLKVGTDQGKTIIIIIIAIIIVRWVIIRTILNHHLLYLWEYQHPHRHHDEQQGLYEGRWRGWKRSRQGRGDGSAVFYNPVQISTIPVQYQYQSLQYRTTQNKSV